MDAAPAGGDVECPDRRQLGREEALQTAGAGDEVPGHESPRSEWFRVPCSRASREHASNPHAPAKPGAWHPDSDRGIHAAWRTRMAAATAPTTRAIMPNRSNRWTNQTSTALPREIFMSTAWAAAETARSNGSCRKKM